MRTALNAVYAPVTRRSTHSSTGESTVDNQRRYKFIKNDIESTSESNTFEMNEILNVSFDRFKVNDYIDFATEWTDTMRENLGLSENEGIKLRAKSPIPIMRYPIRLYGDNETVYSDIHWRKYFIVEFMPIRNIKAYIQLKNTLIICLFMTFLTRLKL